MGLIRINQMGYLPESTKQLVYTGDATFFKVLEVEKNIVVFEGDLKEKGLDQASLDKVRIGDFSEVNKAGIYCIQVEGESSQVFKISDQQNRICTDALLKAFYYQRCGMELTEEHAGPWHHKACHLQPSYVFRQDAEELIRASPEKLERLNTSGGWHDAGDYGRYTVAAAKAVADLLLAYEQYEKTFDHSIGIPESDLKGADLLHEVKYELEFLLKLQRKSDGSVYTKVATRYFCGMIMPEEDQEPLFIFDISSPATAAFAAAMALAARLYHSFDVVFAQQCLEAAKKAYRWLKQNQEPLLFKNPPQVVSGEYGDDIDTDERYWAAAEMYRTTGREEYHEDFISLYHTLKDKLSLGWRAMGGYGTIAYLLSGCKINKDVFEDLKGEWLTNAEELVLRSQKDGYGITLTMEEYKWGSTMILMNESIQLIIAGQLMGSTKYNSVIQNNWDYIFGKNPMDVSYVTDLGAKSIMAPHHRPSAADGIIEPVPGLLSGGPCSGLQDDIAKGALKGQPPAKCFIDHVGSYSTNEITIYWNSPAVYVGAYLSSNI